MLAAPRLYVVAALDGLRLSALSAGEPDPEALRAAVHRLVGALLG